MEQEVVFAHGMSGFLKNAFGVLDGFPGTCAASCNAIAEVNAERTVQMSIMSEQRRLPPSRHSIRLQTDESRSGAMGRFGTTIDACRRPILCELQRLY
jgi:hypothetical protein